MRRISFALLLAAGCGKSEGEIQTAVKGTTFDEASLVEKDKVTVLDFAAVW